MASPYGHVLVGLGLFNLWYPRLVVSRVKTLLLYGLVILGVCSPDLDFVPGLFFENLDWFHHGPFHSLGMAIGLFLIAGFFMAFFKRNRSFLKTSGFVFVLIFSHLLLDFFTEDLKPPFGFPLFWPFSSTYFLSPWGIIPYVERNFSNPAIWSQMLKVFLVESLLFLPFFFYSLKRKACRKKNG
jgi:membrane-bound metal-dependent hydrolase YbcI (DUF457 family)